MGRKSEKKPLVIAESKPKKAGKSPRKKRVKKAVVNIAKPVISRTLEEVMKIASRKGSNAALRKRSVIKAIKRFNKK